MNIFHTFSGAVIVDFEQVNFSRVSKSANGFEKFLNIFVSALGNFAPRKKKYSQGSNIPFMNQTLKKAQMERACLRNSYLTHKSVENKIASNRQRNYCVSLLQKAKKIIFHKGKSAIRPPFNGPEVLSFVNDKAKLLLKLF